ncbi:GrpB family protein [Pedobacter sp. ISL-68]|uniref:GrpB family protein n=1 Tax=unclassified Pedobacter TaxID=2628915 RepID=UPI001BE6296E|nr:MULTISPECIES: GrpB family protein [unclassified Pedobacter]MBT2564422.1 GrpB family protein [Pedobacter sp. ISL-64]MBT2592452.1 GrpB family protein [Pedobacter sp. ISL-68]
MPELIIIEDYSPQWAITFQELSAVYQAHLNDLIIEIQHVGSTSVKGLAAKPVIDIDIIIDNKENLNAIIKKLKELGYHHRGNLGISDREAFKCQTEHTPIDGTTKIWPKHHLYVCPLNSVSLKNHLTLRNFLRNNPEKAKAYGELKKKLALENPYDINLYVERKTPFIVEVLKNGDFNENEIERITQENAQK